MSLEMEFLFALMRHHGKDVKTADLARELGWTEEFGETYGIDLAKCVAGRLATSQVLVKWMKGKSWYVRLDLSEQPRLPGSF